MLCPNLNFAIIRACKYTLFSVLFQNSLIFFGFCSKLILKTNKTIGGYVKNATKFFNAFNIRLRATLFP